MSDHEETIIAGLIDKPERYQELRYVDPSYFTDSTCRAFFKMAGQHHRDAAEAGKIRFATGDRVLKLLEKRKRAADKEKREGYAKLFNRVEALIDRASGYQPTAHEFKDAADDLTNDALDGIAQEGIIELAKQFERQGVTKGVHSQLVELTAKLNPVMQGSQVVGIEDGVDELLTLYELGKQNGTTKRIGTFDPYLDKVTGGGGKIGRYWLVAAYAKDGKTQTAKELVYSALKQGRNCVIVTSEQTTTELSQMVLCRHSHDFLKGGIAYNDLNESTLDAKREATMRRTARDFKTNPNLGKLRLIQQPQGTSIGDVRAILEVIDQRDPIEVIMLDHTGLFSSTTKTGSKSSDSAEVHKEIKELALSFAGRGAWVIACQQVSRDGREQADKRGYYIPRDMADTSESEKSCDVMLYIYRNQELKDNSEARIGVALDRYGNAEPEGWEVLEDFGHSAIFPIASTP